MILQLATSIRSPVAGRVAALSFLRCGGPLSPAAAAAGAGEAAAAAGFSSSSVGSSSSRAPTLLQLSCLSIAAQGAVAELASTPAGRAASQAVALAAAASSATSAPAAAAAAAAAASLAFMSSGSGRYWLRQSGLQGRVATTGLIAANLLSYGAQLISPRYSQLCVRAGLQVSQGQYWRLLTAAFLHGNLIHLGVNMLALHNLGGALEAAVGPGSFMAIYCGSAITGNLAGWAYGNSWTSSMGSSSAIYGLFGAYLTHRFANRHSMSFSRSELSGIGQTIAINMVLMTVFSAHLDHWGHLGGFVGGCLLTYLMGRRQKSRQGW